MKLRRRWGQELFPEVELKTLLCAANRWEEPKPGVKYRQLGVRLWGAGAYERETIDGADTKYANLNRVKFGDIVVNKIWARNGSVAIVSEPLSGCFVSNEFPLFTVDETKLSVEWFELFTMTPLCWEQCDNKARGTSGQNRIRPEKFLEVTIPLPHLTVQKSMVQAITQALSKLTEVQSNNRALGLDFDRLIAAMACRNDLTENQKASRGWKKVKLNDILRLELNPVKVDPLATYPSVGCYSFAKGLFRKAPISGFEISTRMLYRMRVGQFVYLRLKAFEGAFAYVSPEFDGAHTSNEYPTFTPKEGLCRAEWVFAYFKSPRTWAKLASGSKGIGARRERLSPAELLMHEVWMPPIETQQRIAELLNHRRRFDSMNNLDRLVDESRKSLLIKAFRGELSIT